MLALSLFFFAVTMFCVGGALADMASDFRLLTIEESNTITAVGLGSLLISMLFLFAGILQ